MMKKESYLRIVAVSALLFFVLTASSQSLPIDFETTIFTSDFTDFDGGTAEVIANPQLNGINTSTKVAQIIRDGGLTWAGSKIELDAKLDFTSLNSISMKVYTAAPVGTVVKFKLEGAGSTERDVETTLSNEWEVLTWDFTGEPANFNNIVFMFDFGKTGDGSASSTFLFDDIEQIFGGTQIDLPVDFEESIVNYSMTDFGGNVSSLVIDPSDPGNMVMQVVKTDQAAAWAGTTIGTPAGFAANIPLSLSDSKMTIKVWSPESDTPVRLKVENSNDPTQTCETESNITLAGGWEVLEFNFINQAPGTELLSAGLEKGWIYNMASVFFNFGNEGATVGEITYYFDDVKFGELVQGITYIESEDLSAFPNPSNTHWTISSGNGDIISLQVFDILGKLILRDNPNSPTIKIDLSGFAEGIYLTEISTESGISVLQLVKKQN